MVHLIFLCPDVNTIVQVIHYELPNSSEIFVHRSGRTGRAGKKGRAILIHSSNQLRDVKTIERDVGCRFSEVRRMHDMFFCGLVLVKLEVSTQWNNCNI